LRRSDLMLTEILSTVANYREPLALHGDTMKVCQSLLRGWVGYLLVGALGGVACSSDGTSTKTGSGRGGATSTGSGGSGATGGASGGTGGSGATGGTGATGGSGGASGTGGQGGRGGAGGSAGSGAAGGSGGTGGATGGAVELPEPPAEAAARGTGGTAGAGGTGGTAGTAGTVEKEERPSIPVRRPIAAPRSILEVEGRTTGARRAGAVGGLPAIRRSCCSGAATSVVTWSHFPRVIQGRPPCRS
jgi:hypothetical protein